MIIVLMFNILIKILILYQPDLKQVPSVPAHRLRDVVTITSANIRLRREDEELFCRYAVFAI